MYRLPNSNGEAVHQGNSLASQERAYTEGCAAVTGSKGSSAEENYNKVNDKIGELDVTIIILYK